MRQIGDYRILREIGRGGMGVVYEAEQISLGRRVALKVLPGQASSDRIIQERFRREARAAARLHHTNIVPVYDVGQDGDVRFYAMQFIQGLGLDAVISELRRLHVRASSQSKMRASHDSLSRQPRGEQPSQGIEAPTLGAGVEVSAVLQYLTGRLDRRLEPAGASEPTLAKARAGGLATPGEAGRQSRAAEFNPALTRTDAGSAVAGDRTGPQCEHAPAPALATSGAPSSSSAILPGGAELSSVESGRRGYFRSLAQIGRQVAGGLAYAHARGIVHRDIKPSNLLLDTEGVVWITDFGLAKGDDEGLTQSGDILGTLRYMAPERFRGQGDARADLYALGLTLYELLTLQPGFDSTDRLKLIEEIKSEEPRKPRAIDSRIPRDLETIVLKAVEKDPKARYQTAEAMGEDLGRFLADEPIRARQVSTSERYWRWARRNPVIAVLGGVLTALLVATTTASLIVAGRMAQSAADERLARLDAVAARKTAENSYASARKAEKEATEQRYRADHEAEVAQQSLYDAQMLLAPQVWRGGHKSLLRMQELLSSSLPRGNSPDRRGWEWFYLNSLPHQNVRTLTERGKEFRPCTMAWHVASGRLAEGTSNGVIRIWDVDREQTTLVLKTAGPQFSYWGGRWLAWSPDGKRLAAACHDGTVQIWDTGSGRERMVLRGQHSWGTTVAFCSDGTRVAAWAPDGTIDMWDASTGRMTAHVVHPAGVCAGAWSPDDQLLAAGHFDGTVTISGTHARDRIDTLRGTFAPITSLAWSPDSARLAAASSYDYSTRIWEVASRRIVVGPLAHSHETLSVAWEPNGHRLATGSIDETVKIWDANTGRETVALRGNYTSVTSVAWGPNGQVASGSDDGSARVWRSIHDQESSVLPGHAGRAHAASWSPDGKSLASGGDDGKVRIWDPQTRKVILTLKAHDKGRINGQFGLIRSLAWSGDGKRLASAGLDGRLRVWELASGREIFALPADRGPAWAVAWSPDGTHLAGGYEDGTIRVVEGLNEIPKVHSFQTGGGRVRTLAWSPNGERLASGGWGGNMIIWDPIRDAELVRLEVRGTPIMGVAWSPDGKRLASGGANLLVITWDARTGRKLATMSNHHSWVDAVAWSPDGTRLASAGLDDAVRISDPETGHETYVLRGNSAMFHDVSWHPDGARLAAASSDGQIWIWDATRGYERDTTARAFP
jgi:WD40 repeat protein/serine/threonine protein kinase